MARAGNCGGFFVLWSGDATEIRQISQSIFLQRENGNGCRPSAGSSCCNRIFDETQIEAKGQMMDNQSGPLVRQHTRLAIKGGDPQEGGDFGCESPFKGSTTEKVP